MSVTLVYSRSSEEEFKPMRFKSDGKAINANLLARADVVGGNIVSNAKRFNNLSVDLVSTGGGRVNWRPTKRVIISPKKRARNVVSTPIEDLVVDEVKSLIDAVILHRGYAANDVLHNLWEQREEGCKWVSVPLNTTVFWVEGNVTHQISIGSIKLKGVFAHPYTQLPANYFIPVSQQYDIKRADEIMPVDVLNQENNNFAKRLAEYDSLSLRANGKDAKSVISKYAVKLPLHVRRNGITTMYNYDYFVDSNSIKYIRKDTNNSRKYYSQIKIVDFIFFNHLKKQFKMENAIVKQQVIGTKHGENEALKVVYNGVDMETPEQKVDALRQHYRFNVLAKVYGIREKEADGSPKKNVLEINGKIVRTKLPAPNRDEATEEVTENLEEYYNRTSKLAAGAYSTVLKGLERIDFIVKMD